jgi:hypothetical protein
VSQVLLPGDHPISVGVQRVKGRQSAAAAPAAAQRRASARRAPRLHCLEVADSHSTSCCGRRAAVTAAAAAAAAAAVGGGAMVATLSNALLGLRR